MMYSRGLVFLLISWMPLAAAQTTIVDATGTFTKSTESEYDHEVNLPDDQLTFHWNDVSGNTVDARLIHKATSLAEAPSWLAVGFYDTIANPEPVTPSTPFMVGSDAIIGLVENGSVMKYALSGKQISETDGVHPLERQTLIESSIRQHASDDGSVTTVLAFKKLLEEADIEEVRLRHTGENVFLWAVGPPGVTALAKHVSKGAFILDLDKVRTIAEGGASTSDSNISPVVSGECESGFTGPSDVAYEYKVQITQALAFHWKVSESNTLQGALQYGGEAWLAHGVSADGKMVGSEAIIGMPDANTVDKYRLNDKSISGIVEATDKGNFVSGSITAAPSESVLVFETKLDTGDSHAVASTGLNTFLYAVGSSTEFGYHQHRGSYRVDLATCGSETLSTGRSHMGAFAAHGTIATLAWGIASPFAITVAWFRTLVPSSWIYIHVFSNVISFFFTLIAVIIAISAMSVQTRASHFSDPHHWVGLLLLVAVTFQIINGFLRPPVEKRDPYAASHYDMDQGFIKLPSSPREIWYFLHRLTGISMLAMGIFQIQSGLGLFADSYDVNSIAPWFWGYVGLFAFCLISLKLWIMFEEYKARRGMEAMHVDHRSNTGSSQGMSNNDSELVPVQFDMS